jgi:isoquinoline 1-oxidoreductase beta subunit
VQVLWTREDDLANDYFRPAAAIRLRAGLDEVGRVSAWEMRIANASRSAYLGRDDAPGGTEIDAYDFPAGLVPNLGLGYRLVASQVPLGQWRSVASSTNVFATSSFLDELAHLAGRDPIDYFLEFIGPPRQAPVQEDFSLDVARLRRVVERVAALSRWREPRAPGRALGFAAAYTNTSFVAEVVEIETARGGDLRVPRVYAAVDCGRVINPRGAEAQVQGAICEGLSAALHGAVGIANGAVTTRNFDGYRLLRLADAPAIDIAFVGGDEAPSGLGEPALPPVAPALCNAVYAATGRRIRRLPIGAQLAS